MKRNPLRRFAAPAAVALVLTSALAGCGGQSAAGPGLGGAVKIDGSSTVEPLSSAASELFSEQQKLIVQLDRDMERWAELAARSE